MGKQLSIWRNLHSRCFWVVACSLVVFSIANRLTSEVVHIKVLIIVENLPHSLHGLEAVNHAHNGPPPFEN